MTGIWSIHNGWAQRILSAGHHGDDVESEVQLTAYEPVVGVHREEVPRVLASMLNIGYWLENSFRSRP